MWYRVSLTDVLLNNSLTKHKHIIGVRKTFKMNKNVKNNVTRIKTFVNVD